MAASVTHAEPMVNPTSPNEKKFDKMEPSMKAAAEATVGVKELVLLDPPMNESVKLGWFGLHRGQTAAQL